MKYFILVIILLTVSYLYSLINNPSEDNKKIESASLSRHKNYDIQQVQPLPINSTQSIKKVALGERLFHDKRLSHDNTISCSSCHDLKRGGTDRLPTSIGINGAIGQLNAPTVFNSGFNFKQFWDGRSDSLEQQASGPVHNPIEMGSNWNEVIQKLQLDADYVTAFNRIYSEGITAEAIADLLATFQRSLVTPNSRFDQYLRGMKNALSANELSGYQLFKEYGCVSCHQGINLGGNMFQKFGVIEGYFDGRSLKKADYGRFNLTGLEEDRHVFKVPSLRNIAVTAPYLHDGSAAKLEDVVLKMGRYQLGRELSHTDIQLIIAFLKTLTGQWNGNFLQ